MTTIRLATPDDGRELAEIYRHYVTDTNITFEIDPPTAEEFSGRIAATAAFYPYFVAMEDDRIIGYSYASRYHERAAYRYSATASIYLRPDATGKGLGGKMYRILLELLRGQGMRNVYGIVAKPNPASAKLHAALGFRSVGVTRRSGYKLGGWVDVEIFEKFLVDGYDAPGPLAPMPEMDADFVQRTLNDLG